MRCVCLRMRQKCVTCEEVTNKSIVYVRVCVLYVQCGNRILVLYVK